jgi:hypothetical protein
MKTLKNVVFIVNMDGSNVDCLTRRIHSLLVFVLVEFSHVTMLEDSKSTFASAQDSPNKNATRKLDIASASTRRHKKLFSRVNSDSWDF